MTLKPEKQVEKQILAFCELFEIDVDIIDSKATYSERLKTYTKSKSAPEGFPDLVGNTAQGRAVFIELKAKGKLATLSRQQRLFLERKARQGCFAVAVDCPELLKDLYLAWLKTPESQKADFLVETLGKRPSKAASKPV
jgi:hypothetical protein